MYKKIINIIAVLDKKHEAFLSENKRFKHSEFGLQSKSYKIASQIPGLKTTQDIMNAAEAIKTNNNLSYQNKRLNNFLNNGFSKRADLYAQKRTHFQANKMIADFNESQVADGLDTIDDIKWFKNNKRENYAAKIKAQIEIDEQKKRDDKYKELIKRAQDYYKDQTGNEKKFTKVQAQEYFDKINEERKSNVEKDVERMLKGKTVYH